MLAGLVRHVDRNRISLLLVHGSYKFAVGVLMLVAKPEAFSTQSFRFLTYVPGGRTTMAAIVMAGGVLILSGVFLHAKRWAITGLVALAAWDYTLAVGFAVAFANWEHVPGGPPQPTLYPIAVYAHLGTIMVLHIHTMLAWKRTQRAIGAATAAQVGRVTGW